VGSLFAPDLTFNSNITIAGNLTIQGNSDTISSTNTYINDPLVVFNNGFTGTPSYDIGIVVNRNLSALAPYGSVNAAWIWREQDQSFEGLMTTETGTTTGAINNSGFANLKIGNVSATSMTVAGTLTAGSINITNSSSGSGTYTMLYAANFSTGNAQITGGAITGTPISGSTGSFTYLNATNLSTGNAVITGGYVNGLANVSATDGTFINASATNLTGTNLNAGTGVVTNFSTGNAVITGGYVSGLSNVSATSASFSTSTTTVGYVQNFSTGNAQITGGAITGTPISGSTGSFTTLTATSGAITTEYATNFSTGNAQITGGSATGLTDLGVTTAVATNFSTGNAQITGGNVTGMSTVSAAVGSFTNLTTSNITITGGALSGLTSVSATTGTFVDASVGTLQATNFSTANAQITGGSVAASAIAGTVATAQVALQEVVTDVANNAVYYPALYSAASGNLAVNANVALTFNPATGVLSVPSLTVSNPLQFTTLYVQNFSTGNAVISGGYISALANITATDATFTGAGVINLNATNSAVGTEVATNFSTGNAQITGGSATGLTTLSATTAQATNFSTGNAQITGGSATGLTNVTADNGTVANLSSTNAQITGGAITGTPVSGSTGSFTTLAASSTTTITDTTNATGVGTGAFIVNGGASVAKDLYVGGTLYVPNLASTNSTTLDVTDPLLYLMSNTVYPYNYDIGFYSHFTGGSANVYQHTGVVRNNADATWYFFSNAAEPVGSQVDLANAAVILDAIKAGELALSNTTAATSTTTGALTVAGGAGIAGNLYVGGTLFVPTLAVGNQTVSGLSTNNASITGGNVTNITNFSALYGTITNFSTANAQISGGAITGTPISGSTGYFTTLYGTNFSTGNAVISGGYVSGLANVSATAATFSTTNAGALTATTSQVGTEVATNFSTANAVISGGYINVANITAGPGTFSSVSTGTLTATTSTLGDAVATSLTTANAQITGGSVAATAVTGTVVTANVAMYENVTATTNNGTYFPAFYDVTSGNALVYANSSLTFNPGTGVLSVPTLNVSNPMAITTLNAANFSSGNAVITGGYITGLSNISATSGSFTNLSATTSVATNFSAANAQITGGSVTGLTNLVSTNGVITNLTSSNIDVTGGTVTGLSTLNATNGTVTNLASSNVAITGGTVSGISGSFVTEYAQNFSTANARISGGAITGTPISGSTGSFTTLSATTLTTANAQITGGSATGLTAVGATTGTFTTLNAGAVVATGNIVADSGVDSTSTVTGALVVVGGVGVSANIFAGKAATFNSTQVAGGDFTVKGVNDSTLIWAHPAAGYDQVIVGNSATSSTLVNAAKLIVNSSDSMLLPIGTTAQRPSGIGASDVAGMFRYNTTIGSIEWFNGTSWASNANQFTVVTDAQFNGDGTTTQFTLTGSGYTTNAVIVSINGVVQVPGVAYNITGGNVLDFGTGNAPFNGDVIDVRMLTVTQNVGNISSQNGYMSFEVDNNGAYITAGTSSQQVVTYWDKSGAQVVSLPGTTVATANTATTVDSFSATTYRSAKYVIQMTSGTSYQVMEALVIQDGTTAYATVYGVLATGATLGTASAALAGGNAELQVTVTNANTVVKISKTYMLV
jgi:hypothetical protein